MLIISSRLQMSSTLPFTTTGAAAEGRTRTMVLELETSPQRGTDGRLLGGRDPTLVDESFVTIGFGGILALGFFGL